MYSAGKTELDSFIIERVKKMRNDLKLSQAVLATKMDLPNSFISKVENPKLPTKYNIAHLNKLAKIFNCSIKDFFPDKPF